MGEAAMRASTCGPGMPSRQTGAFAGVWAAIGHLLPLVITESGIGGGRAKHRSGPHCGVRRLLMMTTGTAAWPT